MCPQSCLTLRPHGAHQAPLPMRFPSQEYWGGLPFPAPGDLPDARIESLCLVSPALADGFFTTGATQEARLLFSEYLSKQY